MNARLKSLADLCSKYQVDILYRFGSRAKEVKGWFTGVIKNLPGGPSDADIGVKPAAGAAFSVHEKVRLAVALEDLLGVSRVDLVSFRDADPFLADAFRSWLKQHPELLNEDM